MIGHVFLRVSIFLLIITSVGCAYKPKHPETYYQNVDNHILRVSRHGYLVRNEIVLEPLISRDIHAHLKTIEVRKRYGNILKGAMQLSCDNASHRLKSTAEDINSCKQLVERYITAASQPDSKAMSAQLEQEFIEQFINTKRPIKLMVFFHGGLNTYEHTDERMEQQTAFIKSGTSMHAQAQQKETITQHWQYPVFVSWPSNALGTYGEHLVSIREGRRAHPAVGWATSPVVLFEDLVTSIGELPSNIYYQFTNDKDRFGTYWGSGLSRVWTDAFNQFSHLDCGDYNADQSNQFIYKQMGNIHLNRSVFKYGSFKHNAEVGLFTVLSPIRYVFGSVWNGTIAGNAWQVMKRRARNMFDPTGDSDSRLESFGGPEYQDGIGSSLGSFFESLLRLKQRYPDLDLQLTLVGHSMGTIAINNLLEKYKNQFVNYDILTNIVYMAAAASTQETLSIVPEIMRADDSLNFYNLTLNRVSEVAESYLKGLAPSGSLLVSIDKFHDQPEHHLKRTFGNAVNVQSSLPAIFTAFEGVEGQVILKAFNDLEELPDGIESRLPRRHGDFGNLDYWLPKTWAITDDQNQIPRQDDIIQCQPVLRRPYNEKSKASALSPDASDDVLFKQE